MFKQKSYLITGITGFAGAHLANLLVKEGHKVYGLIRKTNGMQTDILDIVPVDVFEKIEFLYGDLTDRVSILKIFESTEFDGVFHLAAQSHPPTSFLDPVDTFRTNVMGTSHIVDAIERTQNLCRLLFCSTSEVYGNGGKDGRALHENSPLAPCNPYAASKAASDLFVQERIMNGKIDGIITRAFSHTGPRRGANFSISADAYQLAKLYVAGEKRGLIAVGNLETVRTVIDVRDVVRAYWLLMNDSNCTGVYNVCGYTPRKMEYFTDALIKISGLEIEKVVSPKYYRTIDIFNQFGSTARLTQDTLWTLEIEIDDTLAALFWYWVEKIKSTSK